MVRTVAPFHHVRVATPCHASWANMEGDDRSRFCHECHKHVYNLSAMTAAEAEDLIEEKEGRLCVRFYQREDGTVLTEDCPVGLRALSRRIFAVGAIAVGIVLAVLGVGGALAFSFRDQQRQGNGQGVMNPFGRMVQWIFPKPAPPPPVVMGKMCPPGARGFEAEREREAVREPEAAPPPVPEMP